ncbi:MAG TPA: hypothetical protein VE861_07430 [Gemmatimonadaceae bacterium]|nr:hypothetical protein [Gemmatimonadaceae bacterium]
MCGSGRGGRRRAIAGVEVRCRDRAGRVVASLYGTKHLTVRSSVRIVRSMATPLREPSAETPALHDRAMQDLSFIRRTMEGASSFTDVPGWGLVAIGSTAVLAATVAARQETAARWLTVWMIEAVLAASLGAVMMGRKIRRHTRPAGTPLLSSAARKFLLGFWPAIFAGAVLTFALFEPVASAPASATPRVLPGLWLLLYGVGITTAGAFSVRAVPLMGLGLIGIGTLALVVPQLHGDVMLGTGFGVLQVIFGTWIARRHGG